MNSAPPIASRSFAISFLGAVCFGLLGAILSAIAPLPGLRGRADSDVLALFALVGAATIVPIAAAIGGCVSFFGFFLGYRRLWLRWTLLLLVPVVFAFIPYLLFEPGIDHVR